MKKTIKKKNVPKADIKASTINIFYNLIIFLLAVLIVYLSYSAYLKIIHSSDKIGFEVKKGMPSEIIQLNVLNGCGISGVADRFTDFLREHDFDVVEVGNYISFDIDESFVIDRIGNKANAIKVAESLGIKKSNIIQQLNDDYFLDVSLIIGKDYYKLKPIKGSE